MRYIRAVFLKSRYFMFCLLFCTACVGQCAPQVYIDRVAPLSYNTNGLQQGLLYELLSEIARRAQYAGEITPLPLLRQRFLIASSADAIGTIWRQPENEDHYRWWCKLFEFSFYLVATPASTHDISTLEAAKHLRVGVILGSAAEAMARRRGFQHIEAAGDAAANLRKLEVGRIDAWIVTPLVLETTVAQVGHPLAALRVGKEVGKLGLYLATSLNFDTHEANKWKIAFESMQKDGSYALIMKKYSVSFDKAEFRAEQRRDR